MADRRSFLRDLISVPLIGGGVTLIGAPSTAVPLVQAAALPALGGPHERARYAWEAFASAMDDLTAGADAWTVSASARATPIPHMGLSAHKFIRITALTYDYGASVDPLRPFVAERLAEVEL